MDVAAFIALALLALLALFQLGLAFGAPWGAAAWGGRNPGVLPAAYRIASGVSILVYGLIGLVIADAAGLVDVFDTVPGWLLWVLVGFFALGTLANAASQSKVERVWAPVSAVIGICVAIIALG